MWRGTATAHLQRLVHQALSQAGNDLVHLQPRNGPSNTVSQHHAVPASNAEHAALLPNTLCKAAVCLHACTPMWRHLVCRPRVQPHPVASHCHQLAKNMTAALPAVSIHTTHQFSIATSYNCVAADELVNDGLSSSPADATACHTPSVAWQASDRLEGGACRLGPPLPTHLCG